MTGVPKVVLVDTNGKIAFIGHPGSTNLDHGIDRLLKGKSLKNKVGSGENNEHEDESSFKEIDLSKVRAEINRFNSDVSKLSSNEIIKKAA